MRLSCILHLHWQPDQVFLNFGKTQTSDINVQNLKNVYLLMINFFKQTTTKGHLWDMISTIRSAYFFFSPHDGIKLDLKAENA